MQLHSLDNLRCFLAAARLLNFSKASKLVALTPAAFGQRLKQLEEQVGEPLFVRTTRSVYITDAGARMLPWAERCVAASDGCLEAVRGNAELPPVDITIGTRHELGMSWLLPRLDELAALRSGLNLHLYVGSGTDLLLRTRVLEIDCAVTSSRFSDPKLDAFRLHREDYVLCASPALLQRLPLSRPAQARAHTLLDISEDLPLFGYWRDSPRGGDRLNFGQLMRLGGIDMIRQRVLAGKGVAVLPAYLVRKDLEHKRLSRLFANVKPLSDHFRLVFRRQDPRRPIFQLLADGMLEFPLS
jgi:DNA-binding transcriptional LysR family regulator